MSATDKQREEQDAWADIIEEIMEQEAAFLAGVDTEDKRAARVAIVRRIALLALTSEDPNVVIKAATWLADRECGRSYQRMEIEIKGVPLPLVLPEEMVDEAYNQANNGD